MAQNRSRGQQRTNRRKKKGGGGGWLVLAILIAAVVGAFVLFPDLLQRLGIQKAPEDLGDAPLVTSNAEGDQDARDAQELPARSIEVDTAPLEAPQQVDVIDEPEVVAAPIVSTPDDDKAQPILDQAEAAYRSYDWDGTRSLLSKLSGLDLSPSFQVRANDLERGADALQEVFERLNTKNELQRNVETHPSLLSVEFRGDEQLVVPLVDMHNKEAPTTDDPTGWVNRQLKATGEVTLQGLSGVAYTAKGEDIGEIQPADLSSIMSEKTAEFESRLSRLKHSDLARDALAWYEAAKFAYRNRLDEQVTNMMDEALKLDPLLASTIKDDLASDIYLKMVQLMEKGNKAGAASWKVKLDREFSDTSIYDEAVAYYLGNLEDLRAAREAAVAKRRAQREAALAARRERAKTLGDEKELAAIAEEQEAANTVTVAATGDLAEANAYYNEGAKIYSEAQSLGVTERRDQLYAKAEKEFSKAMAIYEKLGMEAELVQANQYRYACIKYRRF